jgi:hypothetical protein
MAEDQGSQQSDETTSKPQSQGGEGQNTATNAAGNTSATGGDSSQQKSASFKKKRRRRKKKKPPVDQGEQEQKSEEQTKPVVSEQGEKPPKKKRRRRKKKKSKKVEEPAVPPAEEVPAEPTPIVEEPAVPPAEEVPAEPEEAPVAEEPVAPPAEEVPAEPEPASVAEEPVEPALEEAEFPTEEPTLEPETEEEVKSVPLVEEESIEELTPEEEAAMEKELLGTPTTPVEEEIPPGEEALPVEEELAPEEAPPVEEELLAEAAPPEEEVSPEEAPLAEEPSLAEEPPSEETPPTTEPKVPEGTHKEVKFAGAPGTEGAEGGETGAPGSPSEFKMKEAPAGPVGWDQLKDAIKEDYDETEEAPAVAAAVVGETVEEAPVEEAPSEPSPEVAAEEAPEPEPTPAASEVTSEESVVEDDAERKEIIGIIIKYTIRGCIVIAIIAAIFIFKLPQYLFGVVQDLISGEGQQVEVTQEVEGEVFVPSEDQSTAMQTIILVGQNQGTSLERYEEGVQTVLISGEEIPKIRKLSSGIQSIFAVGLPETDREVSDRIATYMFVLARLQNAFATDVHQLLDNASNRSEALSLHLIELKQAQEEALDVLKDINEAKDELKIEFNRVTALKEKYETDFFASMEQLEANKANDLLNKFIEISQQRIDLKAEYNALAKSVEMFEIATGHMDARIKDIGANREALIKGVKVVDIKGSDIELIIRTKEE